MLHFATIREISAAISARSISSVELTRSILNRIEQLEPRLHAFAVVTPEVAMAQAEKADDELARGQYRGPLHGIPIGVKDLCYTKQIRTAAGMFVYDGFTPNYDATVVARLFDAGAVLLGKLQLTEGANSGYHPTVTPPISPWEAACWPGASSSGSGVATAAGLCFGSIGTDTGGSIRLPSGANGVTGLKPTWGRVSRHGVFPLADSLDHVGPMTRSAADAAIMLAAIAGPDPLDPTTLRASAPAYPGTIDEGVRGLRVGIDRQILAHRVDADVAAAIDAAVRVFETLGAKISMVRIPSTDAINGSLPKLLWAELAVAHEGTHPSRREDYGPSLNAAIDIGRTLTAVDVVRVLHDRLAFSGALAALFDEIDLLVMPVTPSAGMTLAEYEQQRLNVAQPEGRPGYLSYTVPFSASGSPTLTIPCGFTAKGLPIGVQLVGPHLGEASLLRAGNAYQQATDWHMRHPPC